MNTYDLSNKLHTAIYQKKNVIDMHHINELLKAGASLSYKNKYGQTALHLASLCGHIECLEFLLQHGANVHEKDEDGHTPLQIAAIAEEINCCLLLVKYGADINTKNNYGNTLLHLAAEIGHFKYCKFFIHYEEEFNVLNKNGDIIYQVPSMDVNIKNNDGITPLLLQIRPFHKIEDERLQICKYLIQCGAIVDELPRIMNSEIEIKRYKALQTCWTFWTQQLQKEEELIDIPCVLFERGADAIDKFLQEIEKSLHGVYRSRVCIVGPSTWGKTSLVKSLLSEVPEVVPTDNRTIGIDQFQWEFDIEKEYCGLSESRLAGGKRVCDARYTEKHHVSFWDFAGQDVYRGAHSMFFSSSRTLFLICVNLKLYDEDIMKDRNTASDEVLRWLRLIFAKQPSAKLLFVGTKADLVNPDVIQDIKADLSDCVKDWSENYINEIKNSKSSLSDNTTRQQDIQRLLVHLSKVKEAVNGKWVITSSIDENLLKTACFEIQCQIRDRNLGFIMPDSYTAVLEYLHELRNHARSSNDLSILENINKSRNEVKVNYFSSDGVSQMDSIFCSQQDLKRKIRREVQVINNNNIQNDSGVKGTSQMLDDILQLFHDLGEILLFDNIVLNGKKSIVIVDPEFMIDLVREIVRHDLRETLESCWLSEPHLTSSDWRDQLKNGVIYHTMLKTLALWRDLTNAQMKVAKELLHECKVIYPIGETVMGRETNVIVPSLWKLSQDALSSVPNLEEVIARRYGGTYGLSRMCWEYEFTVSSLPDEFFELFIVRIYHSNMEQHVYRNSLELWVPDTLSLGFISYSLPNDIHCIVRIEVVADNQELALNLLKYILSAIENLLQEYPGVNKSPYYLGSTPNGSRMRHIVNSRFLLQRFCLSTNNDWLDENLFLWYYKLFSKDQKDLTKLISMREQKNRFQIKKEVRDNTHLQTHTTLIQNQLQITNNINGRLNTLSKLNSTHNTLIGWNSTQNKLTSTINPHNRLSKMKNTINTPSNMNRTNDAILQSLYNGEKNRVLPALWTAELNLSTKKLYVRLLSDISGKCFHDPIQTVLPLRLLSKYNNKLKTGENVLSIVPPDAIPWRYIDVNNKSGKRQTIYNLISGCSLQIYGIHDTTESRMNPEESKLFLMDLLRLCYRNFSLDQLSAISGLVCGVISDTEHRLWATADELTQFGEKITRL